ncbi:serine hydrolase domain-containing protein [Actinocatenispora sera]|uniref:serine hydrolase domain-containing protein n=1 Tax=Actinocatenispora sera TaxID=390989 RepID=UPI003403199C
MAVDPNIRPGTVAQVDAAVTAAQAAGRVPSLIAGVVRDGALVHVAAAGETPTPTADTQYRIGSISKTLTATLVLRLRDAGGLALDDPLERHLPGTPVGPLTVRQLLGHVSGLQREPDGEWWERSAGGDVDALLAGLHTGKLARPPFAGYHYSNLAYGLLGALLERATGRPWWQLVREQLLTPLGMTRTSYQATEPFARGYVVHPWDGALREEPRHDAGAMAPAGQLWSTVTDLARWAGFLADPATAGGAILSASTGAEMTVPVAISDLESWTAGHGLGVELWRRGERVYLGHTGSMPGYLAVLVAHRRSRTAVVAFANAYTMLGSGMGGFGIDLLTTVLDAEPKPEPVAGWRPGLAPPAEVAPLTGRWWWMGREYEASWADDALVLRPVTLPAGTPWRFTREAPDVWRCHTGMNTGEIMTVRRGPDGAVSALDIATFVFRRDVLPAE